MGFFDDYDANFNDKRAQLGTGAFSTVYRCVNKETGEVNAVKVIALKSLKSTDINKIQREIRICTELDHDNIVRLRNSYHDQTHFYIVFEFVSGGELFDEIVKRKFYNEKDASVSMRQILSALKHCHDRKVIHRDLKPENLLLASHEADAPIKITDFGLAVIMEHGPSYFGFAGTPGYLSPEVIRRVPYDTAVDVWACGVILYILLVGYPPFWEEDQKKLYQQIKKCEFDFPSPEWDTVTDEAKGLIRTMLNPDPKKRPTVDALLKHPWFTSADVPSHLHRQGTIDQLKKFNAKRKLKGGINAVIGMRRIASLVSSMSSDKKSPGKSSSTSSVVKFSSSDKVKAVSEKLLHAIDNKQWDMYTDLVDENLTCFEPEAHGELVTGLDFHKFFFENGTATCKSTLQNVNVKVIGDTAIHTSTRLVQCSQDGKVSTAKFEETRIWNSQASSKFGWKLMHFHRSNCSTN
eukprot:m.240565 g.240565  ORF g.240565 m.240565 type:complete len:464 (-) comp15422_c0_seq1:73-1464(-)